MAILFTNVNTFLIELHILLSNVTPISRGFDVHIFYKELYLFLSAKTLTVSLMYKNCIYTNCCIHHLQHSQSDLSRVKRRRMPFPPRQIHDGHTDLSNGFSQLATFRLKLQTLGIGFRVCQTTCESNYSLFTQYRLIRHSLRFKFSANPSNTSHYSCLHKLSSTSQWLISRQQSCSLQI